jgi:1-acyl-sn-glycerol-3-phosphate acyltransferase
MLRSLAFTAAFYIATALFLLLGSPLLLGSRSWAMAGLRAHAGTCLWLLRMIVGTRMEVRGREHLPVGPCLAAAKHQSAWDTFALVLLFRDPALVMKAELMHIPFYGWFSRKFGMIPIKRETGPSALRQLVRAARARIAAGREVLIFPEGTRRAPGAPPDYKPGVVLLYESLGVPCVPIALNSGLYWPRRRLDRYPGTIVVEFLEPLPPGLRRAEFKALLQQRIEEASRRLVAEAAASTDRPPPPGGGIGNFFVNKDRT